MLLSVLSLSYVDIVCLVSAGILNDEGVSTLLPYCVYSLGYNQCWVSDADIIFGCI